MKTPPHTPPRLAQRFLQWFLREELKEEVQGDLEEKYRKKVNELSPLRAKLNYWYQVFHYLRPFSIRLFPLHLLSYTTMVQHNLKISWRHLIKDKGYAAINIGGLSMGLAVAIIVGLFVWDELSFNQYHPQYDHIGQVWQRITYNREKIAHDHVMIPLAEVMRTTYGQHFEIVSLSSGQSNAYFSKENKEFRQNGVFMEKDGPDLLGIKLLRGSIEDFNTPDGIFISQTMARSYFGENNPVGEILNMNREWAVTIKGVYRNFPANSSFFETDFIGAWELYVNQYPWMEEMTYPWGLVSFQLFVQKHPEQSFEQISKHIEDAIMENISHDKAQMAVKPEVFLHPMEKWHLFSEFENGIIVGGRIEYVRLFGIIGAFVLVLAMINFINLNTARAVKRAKEVGIRKTIGSKRSQLIQQFYCESFLVTLLAGAVAIGICSYTLPYINVIADKHLMVPWRSLAFWLSLIMLLCITSMLSGSYPALYLSSFRPIKVLKGSIQLGRHATLPRKALVVSQFTIAIMLLIGTIVVYQQIQFSKNRPIGYDKSNLVSFNIYDGNLKQHYEILKEQLTQSGTVTATAYSDSPITSISNNNGGISWRGKSTDLGVSFASTAVSHEFGKTVGWNIIHGRDFNLSLASDSLAFIINEAAAKIIGFENPLEETLNWGDNEYRIIGIVENIMRESPYQPVRPAIYHMSRNNGFVLTAKLSPGISPHQALSQVENALTELIPNVRYVSQFVDEQYNKKFENELRLGKFTSLLTSLALLISCLGMFGLVSYVAQRRTKEISIRKVFGATITQITTLLSKEFVLLVFIAMFIAIPIAWYYSHQWLQNFEYRMEISWWIFALTGGIAMVIALLTVSIQGMRTALLNPVDSLRNE